MFKLLLLLFLPAVFSANILYTSLITQRSHFIWNSAIVQALVERGHNVTMLDAYADLSPKSSNYHPLPMKGAAENFWKPGEHMETMHSFSPLEMSKMLNKYVVGACHYQLNHSDFQRLMEYPDDFKFDLIILDISSGYCHAPLIQKFKYPPTVAVTAFLLPAYLSLDFGNHLHPSYINWYGYKTGEYMSFYQRIWNHIYTYFDVVYAEYYNKKEMEQSARELLNINLDPWEKLEKHVSLLLSNVDPILDSPQPVPPNIIPVGGLHARPSKKLPKDIEDIMNNATQGAIIFSLGTNVRPEHLPNETIRVFLDTFQRLKQTVIWKFAGEISNLPKNVYLKPWLPQNDVLGHKNTLLFIGHGGALSTQESIYHGVPVLGIPFCFDQHINVQMFKLQGRGDFVDITTLTSELFLETIKNLLEDPKYRRNMEEASKRFRSYPETQLEKAVRWIEYAIENNGTHFLNPKSRNLPFVVSSGLDIVLFVFVLFGGLVLGLRKLGKLIQFDKKHKKD